MARMVKYEYHIECYFDEKWRRIRQGTQQYCMGFLDAKKDCAPRNALRIVRSDGKVMEEMLAREDVSIGQIAGWPTAEQYERAAQEAMQMAVSARERENRAHRKA